MRLENIFEKGVPIVPVLLTAAYVIGFVVTNVHLARYEVVRFELVRGRYASAALSMTILVLIPCFATSLVVMDLVSRLRRIDDMGARSLCMRRLDTRWMRIVLRSLGRVVISAVAVLLLYMLSQTLYGTVLLEGNQQLTESLNALFGFFRIGDTPYKAAQRLFWSSAILSCIGVAWARGLPQDSERARVRYVGLLCFILFSLVLVSVVFGYVVYPSVRAEFGGGAGWVASLSRKGGPLPMYLASRTETPARNEMTVTVIDHDDLRLVVLICTFRVEVIESVRPLSEKPQDAQPAPGEARSAPPSEGKWERIPVAVAIPLSDVEHYTVFGERRLNPRRLCAEPL